MKTTIILLLVVLSACGGNDTNERKDGFSQTATNPEDSLFKAVMDEHDTAMAKMRNLARSRIQIDSLTKTKPKADRDQLQAISKDLKNAEDHMNQWMEQFSIDSAQDDTKKRIEYLSVEKTKASNVKNEIFSALRRADSVLKK